jgi:histidine phosphotransfer protein HptB
MIDWNRVDILRSEIGAEDFKEVVALFLEEVEEVIDRLKTTPDPAQYEADLHFLKGGALNLGFADLSRLCQKGESAAARGDTKSVDIAAVVALYLGSKQAFLTRAALLFGCQDVA